MRDSGIEAGRTSEASRHSSRGSRAPANGQQEGIRRNEIRSVEAGRMKHPLVSCIMPTWNRRGFIRGALECFFSQTWPNRELVVLDDGDDRVRDLMPNDPRVRYNEIGGRSPLGKKRNYCCRIARGEVICHWDDDDWSAANRISDQVHRLLERPGAPLTGYSNLLFWDERAQVVRMYRATTPGYVVGTSLCYWKSFWQVNPFGNVLPEDSVFIRAVQNRVAASADYSHMVARIHEFHTSPKEKLKDSSPRSLIPAAFWENQKMRMP
jgi:O-antigen biosynthesis protein